MNKKININSYIEMYLNEKKEHESKASSAKIEGFEDRF